MKQLAIIFLFIFVSCNSETGNGIDHSVYEMWGNFTQANPEFKHEALPESYPFHNNEFDAKRLADLIVAGKKKASSSLYFGYKAANADLPKIGERSIVTNFDGKARAVIELTKVDTIPFNQIPTAYAALDMGTDIDALEKWKKAHWDFFEGSMKKNGMEPTEEMLIVCKWFEMVWPK